ncbi:putative hydrolase [Helianthus anomalus]
MMDQSTSEKVQRLPATDDEFGGVVVEMKEHMDSDVFRTLLKASMSRWKLQGKKGVWIKLPIHLSNLVDTVVKEGFEYHHAEPKYLMLLCWIPKTNNPIPANASHIVRVGAVVLNDKGEMLVVQEKMGILRGLWKISTGTVHQGEDITAGVIREVKEETGIDTEFVEVLAFSQEHNVFFGKSEVLFLCMMCPLSFEIQIQETEIEAARWMPLEDYEAQLSVQEQVLRKYIIELCKAKVERGYSGFSPSPVTTDSNGNPSFIYFNKEDLNKKILDNSVNQV